jgi:hypothetical protein
MSQLEEILQVSAASVDEHGERKREAAHGLDRATTFSGRKRHMSSPILPIDGNLSPSITEMPADTSAEHIGAFVSELAAGTAPPDVLASRGAPPPYVLEQIGAAASIDEELRDCGHHVHFASVEDGVTSIELQDRDGSPVRALSIAEVLELAAGRPLE